MSGAREPLHGLIASLACGVVRNQGARLKTGSCPSREGNAECGQPPQAPSGRAAKDTFAALQPL